MSLVKKQNYEQNDKSYIWKVSARYNSGRCMCWECCVGPYSYFTDETLMNNTIRKAISIFVETHPRKWQIVIEKIRVNVRNPKIEKIVLDINDAARILEIEKGFKQIKNQ